MNVLETAVEAAKKNNISTVAVASTTGDTALKLSGLIDKAGLKLIVVTHGEGRRPAKRKFNEEIRSRLAGRGVVIYTHKLKWLLYKKIKNRIMLKFGLPGWQRYLKEVNDKYGAGIKVCHIIVKILMEDNVFQDGRIIAVAGKKKGADSAAIFSASPNNKRPVLEDIIVKGEI